MKFILAQIILIVTLLSGCASGVWNLPTYENLPPKEVGYVVASVGVEWIGDPRISISIRPVDLKNNVAELVYLKKNIFSQIPTDIQNGNFYATVSTRRLIPGRYEIYGAMIHLGPFGTYSNKHEFSYPFEVKAEKVTYLGEFIARKIEGNGAENSSKATGLAFTVQDKMERDFELLKKREISFPIESRIKAVMSKTESKNSIFIRLDDNF